MDIVKNLKKHWALYFFIIISLTLGSVGVYYATKPEKPYTESLYSDALSEATFKILPKEELLYSYSLASGQGSSSGMFAVVVTSTSDIPSITFDVKDQLDRSLVSQRILVGKITRIHFTGKEGTTALNLYAHAKGGNINLTNISVSLNR